VSEEVDHKALDAHSHSSYLDHTQRASNAADSPRPGRAGLVRKLVRRFADAASPRQAEFNVESSAALADLHNIVSRFDLRIAGLEANSAELWAAVGPSGGNNATRALFASHDMVLEDLADELLSLTSTVGELRQAAARADALSSIVESLKGNEERSSIEKQEVGVQITEIASDIDRLNGRLGQTYDDVSSAHQKIQQVRGDLATSRAHVEVLLHEFRAAPEMISRTAAEAEAIRVSDIYDRFEDRFRGSRENVRSVLKQYEDDLPSFAKHGRVLDVGSGRGEWLELLSSHDISAYGVDTSATFVAQTTARGLEVIHADALDHLRDVPEGSLGSITGFHIAEHLAVPVLIELLDRCLIALAQGGRILFETPTPTNLFVGASTFYLDPTHLRPLHPDLLAFLVADRGFVDVEIRYLNPARPGLKQVDFESTATDEDMILQAMFGPRDVAVLASKPGGGEA